MSTALGWSYAGPGGRQIPWVQAFDFYDLELREWGYPYPEALRRELRRAQNMDEVYEATRAAMQAGTWTYPPDAVMAAIDGKAAAAHMTHQRTTQASALKGTSLLGGVAIGAFGVGYFLAKGGR